MKYGVDFDHTSDEVSIWQLGGVGSVSKGVISEPDRQWVYILCNLVLSTRIISTFSGG
jgi:hypothetical protein